MVYGNKQKLFDVNLECILDIKSKSMRFVLSKNSGHEIVVAKMQKLEIMRQDQDVGHAHSHSSFREDSNQNYSYKISGSDTSCFCLDEKKLIYYLSKAIASCFIKITEYENESDQFVKELKDKNFIRVKTKDKAWFNNWIIKIVNKKILGFVLASNKIIIGNCKTQHLDILKYVFDVFGRKNWDNYNTDVVRNILSHEIIYSYSLNEFKKIFPNKLSLMCIKFACIENSKIKFYRNIVGEDPMLFDSWEEALSLNSKVSSHGLYELFSKYGNTSMPSDFIDGMYMINEKTSINNKSDFVNAIGISYAIYDKVYNSAAILHIGEDSFSKFSGIYGSAALFDAFYEKYSSDKLNYLNKMCKYVSEKGIAKNKKRKIIHLVSLYPKYVLDFWFNAIQIDGSIKLDDV